MRVHSPSAAFSPRGASVRTRVSSEIVDLRELTLRTPDHLVADTPGVPDILVAGALGDGDRDQPQTCPVSGAFEIPDGGRQERTDLVGVIGVQGVQKRCAFAHRLHHGRGHRSVVLELRRELVLGNEEGPAVGDGGSSTAPVNL